MYLRQQLANKDELSRGKVEKVKKSHNFELEGFASRKV